MVTVPRLWPGGTVACLASGPSLTEADAVSLRGRVDGVIVVNDAVAVAPWADVLYSSDRGWWRKTLRSAVDLPSRRYCVGQSKGKADPVPSTSLRVDVLVNTGDDGIEADPSGLRTGQNSGYAAVNLALHLGASRILLLGYNMQRVKGRAHFFADAVAIHSPYRQFVEHFNRAASVLKAMGVTVVNCTTDSALACFPRMTLQDALRLAEVAA
jgi:hypothetical protein